MTLTEFLDNHQTTNFELKRIKGFTVEYVNIEFKILVVGKLNNRTELNLIVNGYDLFNELDSLEIKKQ